MKSSDLNGDLNTAMDPVVWFDNVRKDYPGPQGPITAVREVSWKIHYGEIVGLLGPNGAGKTTSIDMMVGLRRATNGTVRTLGLDPVRERDHIRQSVAVQPQHATLFDKQTVAELLRTWASFYSQARPPGEVITELDLESHANHRVGKLSGGQRQRLLVGLALISSPRLLVLDEPSTGLDPNARQGLWEVLRRYRANGGTVIMSTHSMEEAQSLCDRVAIMCEGSMVAYGAPRDLVRQYAPEKRLSFTVPHHMQVTAIDGILQDISTQPDISDKRMAVTAQTLDSDAALAIVMKQYMAQDIRIDDPGLDGVFRRLTGYEFTEADAVESTGTPTHASEGNR